MFSKLLLSASLAFFAAHARQSQSRAPSSSTMPATLPVKMGLWENTVKTSEGETEKTRSCFTKESFQRSVTNMPANCTISNQVWTSHSYSSDVACTTSTSQSRGHLDMQFLNPETSRSTIALTMIVQGKTIPLTITTESHFISADCGGLAPGQSRDVQ
jgi:hypothetical protein